MNNRLDQSLSQTLYEGHVDFSPGQIQIFEYEDSNIGKDPIAGRKLYSESSLGTNASCRICHSLSEGDDQAGPTFYGIATRAETRVTGLPVEEYLRKSIVDPDAYVVEGFPAGLMVPNLEETLNDAQIDDIASFLLTLD